jgi:hypothetical protein
MPMIGILSSAELATLRVARSYTMPLTLRLTL